MRVGRSARAARLPPDTCASFDPYAKGPGPSRPPPPPRELMNDLLTPLRTALQDRYAVERQVGEGGMATVYLAQDLKHRRAVALKVLRPELAATLGQDRFLLEIQLAAGLQHPPIVPVYDSGAADGFLYYVMPFVEGESLRDRLEREGRL